MTWGEVTQGMVHDQAPQRDTEQIPSINENSLPSYFLEALPRIPCQRPPWESKAHFLFFAMRTRMYTLRVGLSSASTGTCWALCSISKMVPRVALCTCKGRAVTGVRTGHNNQGRESCQPCSHTRVRPCPPREHKQPSDEMTGRQNLDAR